MFRTPLRLFLTALSSRSPRSSPGSSPSRRRIIRWRPRGPSASPVPSTKPPIRTRTDRTDGEGGEDGEEGEDDGGPVAPADYLTQKFTSNSDVTPAQVRQAQAQAQAMPATNQSWQLVGPTNVGGRVTGLVVDPNSAKTLYVAASGGGIWKSTDEGDTFRPVWPTTYTQTIGAIAMGSDGTLWVGTGEANPSGGGLTFFGNGVYRSTDGGATWTNVGLRDSGAVGSIVVDPTDPGRVFVAASGNLSGTAAQRGVLPAQRFDLAARPRHSQRHDRRRRSRHRPGEPRPGLRDAVGSPPQQRRPRVRRSRVPACSVRTTAGRPGTGSRT